MRHSQIQPPRAPHPLQEKPFDRRNRPRPCECQALEAPLACPWWACLQHPASVSTEDVAGGGAGILAFARPQSPGGRAGVGTQAQTALLCVTPAKRLHSSLAGCTQRGCVSFVHTFWGVCPQEAAWSHCRASGWCTEHPAAHWPFCHPHVLLPRLCRRDPPCIPVGRLNR